MFGMLHRGDNNTSLTVITEICCWDFKEGKSTSWVLLDSCVKWYAYLGLATKRSHFRLTGWMSWKPRGERLPRLRLEWRQRGTMLSKHLLFALLAWSNMTGSVLRYCINRVLCVELVLNETPVHLFPGQTHQSISEPTHTLNEGYFWFTTQTCIQLYVASIQPQTLLAMRLQ